MIPNIKENPRNRKRTKRGRKRFFNAAIHALRERVERTFAWEDKCKRLLLRFEHFQRRTLRDEVDGLHADQFTAVL
jgi:transposase